VATTHVMTIATRDSWKLLIQIVPSAVTLKYAKAVRIAAILVRLQASKVRSLDKSVDKREKRSMFLAADSSSTERSILAFCLLNGVLGEVVRGASDATFSLAWLGLGKQVVLVFLRSAGKCSGSFVRSSRWLEPCGNGRTSGLTFGMGNVKAGAFWWPSRSSGVSKGVVREFNGGVLSGGGRTGDDDENSADFGSAGRCCASFGGSKAGRRS